MSRRDGNSKSLIAKHNRANDRYKKRLFIERVKEWIANGRILDKMPTLRTYHDDLEFTLKQYGLTDEMHIYRTGNPWPKKPINPLNQRPIAEPVRSSSYPVPHVSDVMQKYERVAVVRDLVKNETPSVMPKLKLPPIKQENST